MDSTNVYIGRQPILDVEQQIFAYELLFRSGKATNVANISDDFFATAQVMASTLNSFGVNRILGKNLGFININEEVINKGIFASLDKSKFVLEILERTQLDVDLIQKIAAMKEAGYVFALDDFVFQDKFIEYFKPIFDYVDYIKVDVLDSDKSAIREKFKQFAHYDVKWLAEKVEDEEMFKFCKQMGFDLFQGYFFAKPTIIEGKKIEPRKLALVELINLLQKDPELPEIETAFKKFPDITINLLRFINSAALGVRSQISSVRQAIVLIGHKRLLQWLLLMTYAGANIEKPNPLFYTASQRAKAMEMFLRMVMEKEDVEVFEEGFLVGLLSLLDALFKVPLEDVLNELDLNPVINDAILKYKGILGKLLVLIRETEKLELDVEKTNSLLKDVGLTVGDLNKVLVESYAWAESSM